MYDICMICNKIIYLYIFHVIMYTYIYRVYMLIKQYTSFFKACINMFAPDQSFAQPNGYAGSVT